MMSQSRYILPMQNLSHATGLTLIQEMVRGSMNKTMLPGNGCSYWATAGQTERYNIAG